MQVHVRMQRQEVAGPLSLMSREVIENDVDLALLGFDRDDLAEEGDELLSRMPRRGLTEDCSRPGVQGCIERESSVAIVLKAVSFGPPGRERQHGVEPIEGLDGGFL